MRLIENKKEATTLAGGCNELIKPEKLTKMLKHDEAIKYCHDFFEYPLQGLASTAARSTRSMREKLLPSLTILRTLKKHSSERTEKWTQSFMKHRLRNEQKLS